MNDNIIVISNTLMKKNNSKIKTKINQIIGRIETEELRNKEHSLEKLESIKELEIEIVK